MSPRIALPFAVAIGLSLACGGGGEGGADAGLAADGGAGGCTTHRDCGPTSDDICDPVAGKCVHDTYLWMPCETSQDCDDFYTSAYRKCSAAKICTQGCSKPGPDAPECVGKEKFCGAGGSCECTGDGACGGTQVCGKVSKICRAKCQQDADCYGLTGTVCEASTGQCVAR